MKNKVKVNVNEPFDSVQANIFGYLRISIWRSANNFAIYFTLFLFAVSLTGCNSDEKNEPGDDKQESTSIVKLFEADLAKLNKASLQSIDKATSLFKDYQSRAKDRGQVDSLFQPYFNFYNSGRNILVGKSDSLVAAYGFSRKMNNGKEYIVPTLSSYLQENVLQYLSQPMQDFTTQQLIEFDDPGTLESRASYTIWWENFIDRNPDFFMSEMVNYHYRYWHMNKLLTGTKRSSVFNDEGVIKPEAQVVYNAIISNYPDSETAGVLKEYLALLSKSKSGKSAAVEDLLKRYRPE